MIEFLKNLETRFLKTLQHATSPSKHAPQQPCQFRWMWRNHEVADFIEWLRRHNSTSSAPDQASFYGLDLYSMSESIHLVIAYLDKVDPEAAKMARTRYGCLTPWLDEPSQYGLEALSRGYAPCEKGVVRMLVDLMKRRADYARLNEDTFLDAETNARVVRDAERYYREMYHGRDESWNLRDSHMFETLRSLIDFHERQQGGREAKAVVWAHNSHVGDARFTAMSKRGELNIGQLCRQHWGNEAVKIICCGTDTGESQWVVTGVREGNFKFWGFKNFKITSPLTDPPLCSGSVAAAHNWDTPLVIMGVRPSLPNSVERVMASTGIPTFMLDLRERTESSSKGNAKLRETLSKPLLERFIGVIYRPETERWSHYSHASLSKQVDCYVWFSETHAVRPLETREHPPKEDMTLEETYPYGL